MVKKVGFTISRYSKRLFLFFLPIIGVAVFTVTPINAYYRLTFDQASAIVNTTNTNIRGETLTNFNSKWVDGHTVTNQTNKYLQGGSTVTGLTLSTIDTDPVSFDGKDYYRKYKHYKKVGDTLSIGISQPYMVATFVLTLENIAEDWHLYVLAPYNTTSGSLIKVGYTSWGTATNGNANYADVTFYELTDYTVSFSYQQYSANNGQYPYQIGIFDIHLPAGNIGSVNLIYDSSKMNYNFTLAVNGIDGSNLVMTQIIEQLTQIQQNQQTIISHTSVIASHITRITTMTDAEADEVEALKDRYDEIVARMQSVMQDADDAWEAIHNTLPDPEDLDPIILDLDNIVQDWDNPQYIQPLQSVFQFPLILTMLILSLTVAFMSYILFGKKA